MATPIPHAKTITFSYLKFSVTYDASKLRAVQDPENMFDDTRGGFVTIDFVDKSSRYLTFEDAMRVGRDFLRVFVQNMGLPRQAAPPPLAAMRKHMTEYFMDNPTAPMTAWRHYLKGVKARVEPVTVNGISGYRAWYTWDRGRSVHYELYKGLDICDLDATSANSTWSTVWPTMNATLHSFKGTQ